MALVTTKRNVDVLPGQAAPTVFHCSQHDVGATIILGLVNAGGNYSIPSGVTAIIQGSCSNGAVFAPVTATVSGSDITFNLSAEMTSIAGPTVCEAVLSKDTDVLGTANFILDVEPSAMGSDTPPVFADAAWLWMVDKMGTETVSALGDKTVIDAIESKLDKNQGTTNAGKYLRVGADGNVEAAATDTTLSISGDAADAKAVGDELDDLKADLNLMADFVQTSININDIDVTVQDNKALIYETGKKNNSNKYELLLFYNDPSYRALIVTAYHLGTTALAVGFFNPDSSSEAYYIKADSVQAIDGEHTYKVAIPQTANIIAICNRKELGSVTAEIIVNKIDTTLTKSDYMADAKSVGDKIRDAGRVNGYFKSGFYTYEDLENDGVIKINSSNVESIAQTEINKTSRFLSLEGVRYIKFSGLYGYYHDTNGDFVGISFVDNAHKHVSAPIEELTNGDGFIDLNNYPGAKFFRFTSANNVISCSVELYSESMEMAKKRNRVYIGAYYFAGWSEWELPNIHFTHSLLHDYKTRRPRWGWFAHGSYRCDAWLYSPEIEIGEGTDVSLSITGSCVFNKDACTVNVFCDGMWHKLNINLGDEDNPDITTSTFDISEYVNKTIKLGFRIFNKNTDISPVWTINGVNITVDNVSIFNRNFINNGTKDFTVNDEETWKTGIPTRAYADVNGYVGTAYDTLDTSVIDKEMILAKEKGIDYFIFDWYYYDNNSSINIPAIENESNNIAVNAAMNAAQKYGFKYCIMISNHSPFIINGLQNWKDTFAYLDQKYFKDPSYLKYEGRPVVNVFRYNELLDVFDELNDYIKTELGYSEGVIWQICQKNTRYNNGLPTISSSSIPQEVQYSTILSDAQSDIRSYYNAQNYEHYFPCLTVRWDTRPWADRPGSYARNSNYCVTTVSQWKEALRWAIQWARGCQTGFKSFLIYAWNEMGEGGYLVPTDGDSEGAFLGAINDVIKEESKNLIM